MRRAGARVGDRTVRAAIRHTATFRSVLVKHRRRLLRAPAPDPQERPATPAVLDGILPLGELGLRCVNPTDLLLLRDSFERWRGSRPSPFHVKRCFSATWLSTSSSTVRNGTCFPFRPGELSVADSAVSRSLETDGAFAGPTAGDASPRSPSESTQCILAADMTS